jgi:hypothetical protein
MHRTHLPSVFDARKSCQSPRSGFDLTGVSRSAGFGYYSTCVCSGSSSGVIAPLLSTGRPRRYATLHGLTVPPLLTASPEHLCGGHCRMGGGEVRSRGDGFARARVQRYRKLMRGRAEKAPRRCSVQRTGMRVVDLGFCHVYGRDKIRLRVLLKCREASRDA